jgi:hypothetical protein
MDKNIIDKLRGIFSFSRCEEADKILYVSFPEKEKQIINSRILYKSEFEEWQDVAKAIKYLKINYYHILIRREISLRSEIPNISRS